MLMKGLDSRAGTAALSNPALFGSSARRGEDFRARIGILPTFWTRSARLSLPAQSHSDGHDDRLTIALVGAMIAVFEVKPGVMEPVETIVDSTAKVETARILGVRRHGLGERCTEDIALNVPPSPCGLVNGARPYGAEGNRDAAPVETNTEDSVGAQFSKMAGHRDNSIQADGLHIPALIGEALRLLYAWPEVEIVIHVLGIDAEQAIEVETGTCHSVKGVANIASDVVLTYAKPNASVVCKAIESWFVLGRSHRNESAKDQK
jgi:hypothetical protein